MTEIFVGLMSGTSIDAIDAAAVAIDGDSARVVASLSYPIPQDIKHNIASLCQAGENEIVRTGQLDFKLGKLFAEATLALLRSNNLDTSDISAIGCHGQTIRHLPYGDLPFTLQIGNPALICELTNITTVADFRRADMAAGGQGAPLVPAFHHAVFYDEEIKRVVLNIGGMANISILEKDEPISGFDTGPGNILLNEWIQQEKSQAYDKNGKWSAENSSNPQVLKRMLDDSYFSQPPPKSTGREHFNLHWIKQIIANDNDAGSVQSTLCELTAKSIADAIAAHAKDCKQILVCGGGVHNTDLMTRLKQQVSSQGKASVFSTTKLGIDPDYVEAAAFAWFARQTLHSIPSNAPAVTGARHPVLQGAIYPAISH